MWGLKLLNWNDQLKRKLNFYQAIPKQQCNWRRQSITGLTVFCSLLNLCCPLLSMLLFHWLNIVALHVFSRKSSVKLVTNATSFVGFIKPNAWSIRLEIRTVTNYQNKLCSFFVFSHPRKVGCWTVIKSDNCHCMISTIQFCTPRCFSSNGSARKLSPSTGKQY